MSADQARNNQPLSNPGVVFPPPLYFVIGFAAGWVLQRFVAPLTISSAGREPMVLAGAALVLAGVVLAASGAMTFRRAKTAIIPIHSASRLVASGPYRFTRNPMYSGFAIAYVGGALLLDSAWPLLLLPVVLLCITYLVIHREERYLSDAFGADYQAYRARVSRWL